MKKHCFQEDSICIECVSKLPGFHREALREIDKLRKELAELRGTKPQ